MRDACISRDRRASSDWRKAAASCAFAALLAVAGAAAAQNLDGDGVADAVDNCVREPNPHPSSTPAESGRSPPTGSATPASAAASRSTGPP